MRNRRWLYLDNQIKVVGWYFFTKISIPNNCEEYRESLRVVLCVHSGIPYLDFTGLL